MKKRIPIVISIIFVLFLFYSCDKQRTTGWDIKISLKSAQVDIEECKFIDVSAKLREANTGNIINIPKTNNPILTYYQASEGSYIVEVEGKLIHPSGDEDAFKGKLIGFSVFEASVSTEVEIFLQVNNNNGDPDQEGDFIIKEVFFTGTLNEQGQQYDGDKYIIIVNNSNKDLYADGLGIAMSHFQFNLGTLSVPINFDYVPDIVDQAFAICDIIQIPGEGTDLLVKPGEQVIICDNAIKHTDNNPKSIDFTSGPTKANFEWFTDLNFEVNNPEIPNMINFYSWNKGFIMHNRGLQTLALVRFPEEITADIYAAEYKREFTYTFSYGGLTKTMEVKGACIIPNEWIIDGVCSALKDDFGRSFISQSIDMGFTWCSKNNTDYERYGKSVCRKVVGNVDGVIKYQDTNNSTEDFIPLHTPTLLTGKRLFSYK